MTNDNIFSKPESFREHLASIQSSEPTATDTHDATESTQQVDTNVPQDIAALELPEPQPEVESVEASESEEEPVKGHLIPKSRFNQELEKRKSLEEQLRREQEDKIRLETQLKMFSEMQQQANAVQHAPQEEAIDPLDADTYNYARKEIEQLKHQMQNMAQETAERTTQLQYYNTVSAQEQAFEKEHPDFRKAWAHVEDVEFNIAKSLMGDERKAQEYVVNKLQTALITSLNSGKNAAETIYNMAKTYGYQAQSAPPLKKDVNLNAINKNMERTVSTSGIGNNAAMTSSIPTDITTALDKYNRVDPNKFHQMIKKQMNQY